MNYINDKIFPEENIILLKEIYTLMIRLAKRNDDNVLMIYSECYPSIE